MNRIVASKIFNGFGYFGLYMQLMWAAILLLPTILSSGLLTPSEPQAATPPTEAHGLNIALPDGLSYLLITVMAALFIGFIFYALKESAKMTYRAGEKVTNTVAQSIIPTLRQHKRISRKRRQLLNKRAQLFVKILLCAITCLISLVVAMGELPIPRLIAIITTLYLLPWGIIWFILSYLLAPPEKHSQ